jgi:phosphatidylglycerophosphate synthase
MSDRHDPSGGDRHDSTGIDWRARAREVWTVPNLVSLSRLPLLAGIVVWLDSPVRYLLFAVLVLSDGLDGWLARRLDQKTELGALLDPALDKLVALALVVVLFPRTDLAVAFLALFFLRDAFVLALAPLVFVGFDTGKIAARTAGKVVTNVQFLAMVAMLGPHDAATEALLWLLAPVSAVAIADYAVFVARELTDREWLHSRRGAAVVYAVVGAAVGALVVVLLGGELADALAAVSDSL